MAEGFKHPECLVSTEWLAAHLNDPKVVVLADEPTGNLDQNTAAAVMDLLFGLRERLGTTLLLITHDPLLAARCGRAVRMADGLVTEDA